MIVPFSYGPNYTRAQLDAREKRREEISKELEARGMVRGHGKFDEVVQRKLRKFRMPEAVIVPRGKSNSEGHKFHRTR